MSKPKLLLIGYRAYGDWLYAAPILPYLFEKYDVYADVNQKGYELFYDDPRFTRLTVCGVEDFPLERAEELAKERWAMLEEKLKPDKVINLWRTLEVACISERHQSEFFLPVEERRKIFGHKNFYEAVFKEAEIPMPEDFSTEGLWFSEDFTKKAEEWRQKHLNDFVIIMPVAGTCIHKVWQHMYQYSMDVLDKYPNAYIYLVGGKDLVECQWDHPRVVKCCGELSMKQTVLMTKYADYVIGNETGVLVAAGMWGTHKTMLCTAAGVEQANKYQKNDHSLQAEVECSPCHRAVYNGSDCEKVVKIEGDPRPACIGSFDLNKIMSITGEVYNERNIYNEYYYERYIEMSDTDKGHEIYQWRWDLVNKHCTGLPVLDYGCATGAFLDECPGGHDLYGYEINPNTKDEYKHLPENMPTVLTMWDVLEHLKEPMKSIEEISPEWLFLTVPNVAQAPENKTTWKHWRPGEHLHYWTLDSLTKALKCVGYRVVENSYGEGAIRDPHKPRDLMTVVARRI